MDYFNLAGKVAIVTGGSKGLGRTMALGLGAAGAKVVVVSRTKQLIEETADEIIKQGGEAIAVPADVKDAQSITNVIDETIGKFDRVDILVNNAGIAPLKSAIEISDEEWNDVLDTNLKSMFFAVRAIGPILIEQKGGKIINIGSVLGKVASNSALHYCVSKAGIIQMTRALAFEWAPFNINVNCIAPGYFETEMTHDMQENEKQMKYLNLKIPFKRLGRPEEIAGTAIFLASDASSYITGETIFVDGGYSIW